MRVRARAEPPPSCDGAVTGSDPLAQQLLFYITDQARGLTPSTPPPLRERNADAPVQLALLLDSGDGHATDLAGAPHVRSAARLQIHRAVLADDHKAHAAGTHGWLHRHR